MVGYRCVAEYGGDEVSLPPDASDFLDRYMKALQPGRFGRIFGFDVALGSPPQPGGCTGVCVPPRGEGWPGLI